MKERTDWLTVAGRAHAWMGLATGVRRQVQRDLDIDKIPFEDYLRVTDQMTRAWEVFEAESSAAFALHSAQRQGVSLDTIVADLHRDQQ